MGDGRGGPGIVAVVLGLARAVRVHLKERLGEDLAAVIVIPPRVDDPAVIHDGRIHRMDLIESKPSQKSAVAITGVQIAHLGVEAIHLLNAPR